ncbi:hypothetical protein RJZ56_002065 [Blastomyces dermatitidis]
MQQRIERVAEDLNCLKKFYNIPFSPERVSRLQAYYNEQLSDLSKEGFDSHSQDGNIDYLLLQNYLKRNMKQLDTLMRVVWFLQCLRSVVYLVGEPYGKIAKALEELTTFIGEKLMGTTPGDEEDAIVGKPIGRDGLLVDLGVRLK